MTLGELKKELEKYPDDAVLVRETTGYYCVTKECNPSIYYNESFHPAWEKDPKGHEEEARVPFIGKKLLWLML